MMKLQKIKKNPRDKLIEKIHSDPSSIKFRKNVLALIAPLNLEKLKVEVLGMQKSLQLRNLTTTQVIRKNHTKIITLLLETQQFRTRCQEIKVNIYTTKIELDSLVNAYYDYVLGLYSSDMRDIGLTTKGERDNFVSPFYEKGYSWQRNVDLIIEIINIFTADLDQSYWTLVRLQESLKGLQQEKFN